MTKHDPSTRRGLGMSRRSFLSGMAVTLVGATAVCRDPKPPPLCTKTAPYINKYGRFHNVAMRGKSRAICSSLPGNTRACLEKLATAPIEEVELDILSTSDMVPVLGHVSQLQLGNYTTCSKSVVDMSIAELMSCKRLDVGGSPHGTLTRLDDALKLPFELFFLDLKLTIQSYEFPREPYLDAILAAVEEQGMKARTTIMTYDFSSVAEAVSRGFQAGYKTYLDEGLPLETLVTKTEDSGGTMMCFNGENLTTKLVQDALGRDIWMLPWTTAQGKPLVESVTTWHAMGIEGVISPWPDALTSCAEPAET